MRIICRNRGHSLIIRDAEVIKRENSVGRIIDMPVTADLTCEFKSWHFLTDYERGLAATTWNGARRHDNSYANYGALPSSEVPPVLNGIPFMWWMSLSVFDTEDLEKPDDRAYAEQFFSTWTGGGSDFLVVKQREIPAPWPSYDSIIDPDEPGKGRQTAASKIASLTRELGIDPAFVVEYEKTHQNRPAVVDAVLELAKRDAEKRAEDSALTRSL